MQRPAALLKMENITEEIPFRSRRVADTAIIYAGDYLNKLSGERIERECKRHLESGCCALIINFQNTELVNSIGVSVLMGVIDAAEQHDARLVFCDVNIQTAGLFEMLGLTRHVSITKDEEDAFGVISTRSASKSAS